MTARRSAAATRQIILEAAIQLFSSGSYEDVTLRNIASAADVDVALVHRYFGSKEQLFREAIKASSELDRLIAGDADTVADAILERILETARGRDTVGALQILVRSLSSSQARDVLHDFVEKDFIAPLCDRIAPPSEPRAAVLTAFLTGLGIMRDVIGIEALRGDESPELRRLLQAVLAACLTDRSRQDD